MEGFSAVVTTGIYCRPGCSARPDARNVRPFELAAAAEAAGFRACHRCRPYRGTTTAVDAAPELVCRAVRLIVDGALDGATEEALGARVGVSARHLRRLFTAHLGVTPDQLARSRRAHFARRLLDDTDLTVTDIAFAAGFGSVRQLHRACVEVFRGSPTDLRARRRKADRLVADGGLRLRLPYEGRLDWRALLGFLAPRALPGVEQVDGEVYRRIVEVDGDPGVLELGPGGTGHLVLTAHLPHWEGLIHLADRARRLAGLDHDQSAAEAHLAGEPVLAPLVATRPGLRVPGTWDGFETGVRAILGQQVSVAAATTMAARLAQALGPPVPGLAAWGLTHRFPDAERVEGADPALLTGLGLTRARAAAVQGFAAAVAGGHLPLDGRLPLDDLVAAVTAIPGLGPWTAHYLAMRLGERDAFPVTDLVLRRALDAHGVALPDGPDRWRPWRAVATMHLWAAHPSGDPAEEPRGAQSPVAAASRRSRVRLPTSS